MQLDLSKIPSPLGDMLLVTDSHQHIRALDFSDHHARCHRLLRDRYPDCELRRIPPPTFISDALQAYFAGDLTALDVLLTAAAGTGDKARRIKGDNLIVVQFAWETRTSLE